MIHLLNPKMLNHRYRGLTLGLKHPDFEIWGQVLDPVLCGYWRKTVGECSTMQLSASLTLSLFKGQGKCISFLVPVLLLSHFSHVLLFVIQRTVACQAPLSMGFSRQYWGGLPWPPPGDLPGQGSNPGHLGLLHW